MPEKNIFVYKLSLSLNISDFSLFFVKTATALEKVTPSPPPLFQQPPLKAEVLSSPASPFLKIC